jgi:trans-aconitate methyltransferase
MTEWAASDYARISELQKVMAEEALGLLKLEGWERVLDIGCGDGKITAEIAARVPQGTVVGVDPSVEMVRYAQSRLGTYPGSNLQFGVSDARRLPFRDEFDLVVSFNALHWVPEQEEALTSIGAAMKAGGRAQLRFVGHGPRKSLEHVLRETRQSPRWVAHFEGFHRPYLHLSPEQYAELAEKAGLTVESVHLDDKSWDFHSRQAFCAFAEVTFVEWTHLLSEADKASFTNDVLDRYKVVVGEANTFKFYQMDVRLVRPRATDGGGKDRPCLRT